MRFIPIALALFTALGLAPAARAELQCMARSIGQWVPWHAQGNEVSTTACEDTFTSFEVGFFQTYRLQTGPLVKPDQVTCQWTAIPSGTSLGTASFHGPESIICTLFTSNP